MNFIFIPVRGAKKKINEDLFYKSLTPSRVDPKGRVSLNFIFIKKIKDFLYKKKISFSFQPDVFSLKKHGKSLIFFSAKKKINEDLFYKSSRIFFFNVFSKKKHRAKNKFLFLALKKIKDFFYKKKISFSFQR